MVLGASAARAKRAIPAAVEAANTLKVKLRRLISMDSLLPVFSARQTVERRCTTLVRHVPGSPAPVREPASSSAIPDSFMGRHIQRFLPAAAVCAASATIIIDAKPSRGPIL